MFIVFKNKTTFDQVEYKDVKNVSFNGVVFTVTKADSTTATYAADQWHMWSFN